ncbi:MAG: hypothetical protein ACJ77A_06620 [Actinomycetota bacterium]
MTISYSRSRLVLALVVVVVLAACTSRVSTPSRPATPVAQPTPAAAVAGGPPATPVDAVRAIVDALRDHAVVALGESHNLANAGEFYESLVRSDALAAAADDVVVEFGNARYQALVDRYVSGRPVAWSRVRRIWQDTTQVGAWDAPMYARFFTSIRAANERRPPSHRIRVLLGDPPIDWRGVHTRAETQKYLAGREAFMARVIEHEVIAEGEHAVVIAGLAHLERPTAPAPQQNVTQRLDSSDPGSTYVVAVHLGFPREEWEQRLAAWPVPSIAAIRGTWIGNLPKGEGHARDALDAVLYLGPPDSLRLSIPLPSVYRVEGYWRALRHRWGLEGLGPFSAAALFRDFSGAVYPGAFSPQGIQATEEFAACMRAHGVGAFPDPQFQYDAVGFYGPGIQRVRHDPDFAAAQRACFAEPDEASAPA